MFRWRGGFSEIKVSARAPGTEEILVFNERCATVAALRYSHELNRLPDTIS